ncbi:hypothetical protein ACRALDRAFT_1059913 [Sodiomyces alcalophilus JCM 7366]|uniref:uncharacterized protein n=1 Tax=Sodiomyces alcalophilus JCM 7366 TaxID=591952 RepID=UPI0039B3E84B
MDIASASRPKVIPFQGVADSASDEDDDVPNSDLLPHHTQAHLHARVAGDSSRGLGGRLRSRVRDGVQRALNPWLPMSPRRPQTWTRVPQSDDAAGPDRDHPRLSSADPGPAPAPAPPPAPSPSHGTGFRALLLSSWVNALLVFVPIGIASYVFGTSPILTFITNVVAIVPLSALLTDATEQIANDAGDTIGALLNISLGNLVELIIFVALVNNHIRIVQASILGSILVNLLLILGSALLASTVTGGSSACHISNTQLLSCLLLVSLFVFLVPTAFDYTFERSAAADEAILQMSRISSLMILLIYVLYFIHELRTGPLAQRPPPAPGSPRPGSDEEMNVPQWTTAVPRPQARSRSNTLPPRAVRFANANQRPWSETTTHGETQPQTTTTEEIELANLDNPSSQPATADRDDLHRPHLTRPASSPGPPSSTRPPLRIAHRHSGSLSSITRPSHLFGPGSAIPGFESSSATALMRSGPTTLQILRDNRAAVTSDISTAGYPYEHASAHAPRPTGARLKSVIVLVAASMVMSVNAEFLVSAIDDVTHQGHLSEPVIGLIILPIVGNLAEYITVVTVAARDKLELAIAVAVGSSIQIALCVTPLTVIAGWILHRNLALTFNFFEMATLVGSVLLVNLLILNDGNSSLKAGGLKGALMCACFAIIGLGAYLSPESKAD